MSIKKKTRNKEATIEKIYGIFFKLVLEEGFHKASTNKIAKEAKISIGTLYHHFPEGKKEIIRRYFENSVERSFDLEEFKKLNMSNIASVFRQFVLNVLRNHDESLAQAHKERVVEISTGIVKELQETSEFFKSREKQRLIRSFVFIYNIINAIIYHHIVFMDLFQNDEDLIDYVSNLLAFTIKYLQKT
ncbi:MAG: TetR/AcrR family transcriptional regulator [Promethearchaeota archaeon]